MDLSRTTTRSAIVAGVALALLLAGCGAQDTESATDAEPRPSSVPPSVGDDAATSASGRERGDPARGTRSEQEARQPGQYVELADYLADPSVGGDDAVVIFFHAPWCPDCVATDASLRSDGVPDGLTVVKADFDTETDLRARYGVTVQHSFVQLDGDEAVRAWTGSRTGADIAAELG
jgi:thioredoxin 1